MVRVNWCFATTWLVLTYNFGNMEADNVEHLGHHGAVHEGVQGVDVQRGDVVHLEVKSIEEGKLRKKMQRSSLLFGGQNLFGSFKHFLFFTRTILNSSFSSSYPGTIHHILRPTVVQNSQRGKELNKFCPPISSDDLCLFFCIYPSSIIKRDRLKTYLLIIKKNI